jgi:hypothetical protein
MTVFFPKEGKIVYIEMYWMDLLEAMGCLVVVVLTPTSNYKYRSIEDR